MIPVDTIKTELLKKYPNLTNYPEFRATMPKVDIDKVIVFLVYVYDQNGLVRYIDDIFKRRMEAATLAEFPIREKAFEKPYEDIVLWKNEKANLMGLRYCRIQRSPAFSILVNYEEQLYSELQVLGAADTSERKTILNMIDTLRKGIEELRQQIFLSDNSKAMYYELLESLEDENLDDLRPEGIAMKRKLKHKLLDYNPYESV